MQMNRHLWMVLCCGTLMRCACPSTDTGTNDAGSSGSHSSTSSANGGSSAGTSRAGSSNGGTSNGGATSTVASSGGTGSSAVTSSGGNSSGGTTSSGGSGATSGVGSSSGGASSTSAPPQRAFIFAHSAGTLYRLDADTLDVVQLGDFTFLDTDGTTVLTGTDAKMTDLAVTSDGQLWGCSSHNLFAIEPDTWRAVKQATLTETYVGLTWVPLGILDPGTEVLVGATSTGGSLYRINPQTGATTLLGAYGGNWLTSGDVVSIAGDGMYATLKTATSTNDVLARIEPTTGVATIIGENVGIGSTKIFGLGYWGGVLYGFDDAGHIISINRDTGVGTVVVTRPVVFWGAGVTTSAKVH